MFITATILGTLTLGTILFLRHPGFGKAPSGERMESIKASPNFRNGKFENLSHTPNFTEGYTFWQVMYKFFFEKAPRRKPTGSIPSVKTDLRGLPQDEDVLVWFGHSSYYLQVEGKRMLVDPVFSGNASPLPGTNRSFRGSDRYRPEDMPDIDYLFLTHDHYDHADYATLVGLKDRCKKIFCGLGVGAHLEHWGFAPGRITEHDWHASFSPDPGFSIHTAPARHFSGRGFQRNNTLWLSFVLKTRDYNIYLGGDSGYDRHFRDIGDKHGPFDLAILDNGQYNLMWQAIHMLPDEVLKAARDLRTKKLMPVHSGKFAMAKHPWDEPLQRITELNRQSEMPVPLVTPMIGEPVWLRNENQSFTQSIDRPRDAEKLNTVYLRPGRSSNHDIGNMITLQRTNSENPDFVELVKLLDAYLAECDGEDHAFYDQFNKIVHIRHVVLAYEEGKALGCGAIKEFSPDGMEVKRMYVRPEGRQKGIATRILDELERWAKEMGYTRTILETGSRQTEAIELYTRRGYDRIPNYGQYAGVDNSLCFEKKLA